MKKEGFGIIPNPFLMEKIPRVKNVGDNYLLP